MKNQQSIQTKIRNQDHDLEIKSIQTKIKNQQKDLQPPGHDLEMIIGIQTKRKSLQQQTDPQDLGQPQGHDRQSRSQEKKEIQNQGQSRCQE